MRMTLRRSCAACAKAKHSCDLQTPKCSRCAKKISSCVYANEPLTSTITRPSNLPTTTRTSQDLVPTSPRLISDLVAKTPSHVSALPMVVGSQSFDPFDSYPSTNLPRLRVQGLIHHFLSKIAFQYYPLDLNPSSNPFITSWWPLALSDPALFNVSLQTACLDDELLAQRGFPDSEILMKDSVSLIRRKVQDNSLAFQDATMDAVVTLAAIELGKGNLHVSKMHIDGIKRMVNVRGGISRVKQTSPITARMVSWVSMLVMGSPQFLTQDDFGVGNGISTIKQWQCISPQELPDPDILKLGDLGLNPGLQNIITRLRIIFGQSRMPDLQNTPQILSTTDLHDLTCFVLHRLLLLPSPIETGSQSAIISECIRYATSIYMFIIHGPTYYSHAAMLNSLVIQLEYHVGSLISCIGLQDPLITWLLSVGTVASMGTDNSKFFTDQAITLLTVVDLQCWEHVRVRLESVLWLDSRCGWLFRQAWEELGVAENYESTSCIGV